MKITLHDTISPALGAQLAEFEQAFAYPLGEHDRFRIDHGVEYLGFYASLGRAFTVVAHDDETIAGTVCATLRTLRAPNGAARRVWYIGDLKVARAYRGTGVLRMLATRAFLHGVATASAAFGVVMDGTARRPEDYAVRTGVPSFARLQTLNLWQLDVGAIAPRSHATRHVSETEGVNLYTALATQTASLIGGEPQERSRHTPAWISTCDERAIGRIEDTSRAKRLVRDNGSERRIGHVAHFAARDADAAHRWLDDARRCAASRGYETLMVSLPESISQLLTPAFTAHQARLATASLYGLWLREPHPIHVNSSEI